MAQITINEGLAWLKTLKQRHEEMLALRNDNAHLRAALLWRLSRQGDRQRTRVRRESPRQAHHARGSRNRLLEQALKATNARTTVDACDQDNAVLGELT